MANLRYAIHRNGSEKNRLKGIFWKLFFYWFVSVLVEVINGTIALWSQT